VDGRNIKELYFEWLYSKVLKTKHYKGLLMELDRYDYIWKLPMDANSYEHGTELRYRFGNECGIDHSIIASELDIRQCSMLEMMVSLTLRISEVLLDDGSENHASMIFTTMLDSLGLSVFTDRHFDRTSIYSIRGILDSFVDGDIYLFPPNGEDFSRLPLWNQAHRYLIAKGDI
jgi:hypothetical protein